MITASVMVFLTGSDDFYRRWLNTSHQTGLISSFGNFKTDMRNKKMAAAREEDVFDNNKRYKSF